MIYNLLKRIAPDHIKFPTSAMQQVLWQQWNLITERCMAISKSRYHLRCLLMQTVMKHAVEHYFGGGSELLNMHERLADLLLIALSSSFEDAGDVLFLLCLVPAQPASLLCVYHACSLQCLTAGWDVHGLTLHLCHADLGIDIEERGLVVNWSTFRFAFCQGGDGESDMTMDVQDLAMFVRDPGSVVTCILLPLSASTHMHQQVCRPLGLCYSHNFSILFSEVLQSSQISAS